MATNNAASEVNCTVANLNNHLATALAGGSGINSDEAGNKSTIITLAGENSGATMEAEGDVEDLVVVEAGGDDDHDEDDEDEVQVTAYTNSNYQAINNSMVVAGSCAVRDPGVHVVIVEHVDDIRDCGDNDFFGSPTASRMIAKILYATSKQGMRRPVLDGVHYELEATDPSEMAFDVIRGRAQ